MVKRGHKREIDVTDSESEIMCYFRRYLVSAGQMLFFNAGPAKLHPLDFRRAMASLISDGLVVQERHRDAFSLTQRGYQMSLSARTRLDSKNVVLSPCRLNVHP